MTESEFVALWHHHLTGMALTGLVDAADEKVKGPFDAGKKALEMPRRVEQLLIKMYRSMNPPKPITGNGVHAARKAGPP